MVERDWSISWSLFNSVLFSRSVMSDSLQPHELQHARLPCPSPTPRVHSNSHPLSQWCHPAISSSVVPFSSCPQFLPASEPFPMSQLFAWGGQSTGVSALASFHPKNTQGWSPLEWTGWISLKSKGLSRVFSNTTVHYCNSIFLVFLAESRQLNILKYGRDCNLLLFFDQNFLERFSYFPCESIFPVQKTNK